MRKSPEAFSGRSSTAASGIPGVDRIRARHRHAEREKDYKMTRREAREQVLALIFETGFRTDEAPEDILNRAAELREFEINDYIREVYCGTLSNLEFIDKQITAYSNGWSLDRISPVSRAILRLAVYEMFFRSDIPDHVSVNEAVELVKKFDDEEKVRKFVNGILNSILKAKTAGGDA